MKLIKACGCGQIAKPKCQRKPTDAAIEATPEELASIRSQLGAIEILLSGLYGDAYGRGATTLKARTEAADLIDCHFDGIVEGWARSVALVFGQPENARHGELLSNLSNALIRFVLHLRDDEDITTYVHLRKHCQEGMLSRALPSQFNVLHIALKQIILDHVHATLRGTRMELVRDAVVGAIDERRLMVAQFYIESRERALRASEEKYRNSIDHAPDPMYEIEPETWRIIGINSAAEQLHRRNPDGKGDSVLGSCLLDDVPAENRPAVLGHLRTVMEQGSDETLDYTVGTRYFDVHSALIPYGNKQFIQLILRDVTQRRGMLDQLLKTERLAAAGTFAAGVAHEVNNPLASISSLVQSLLPSETDPARRTVIHTILSQITRISTTLKDLVNFARPSSAQKKVINLNDLVTETLRLVGYNKRFERIRIEPVLAGDLKPVYAGDNEIQQVLLNLLLNAADASHRPDSVIRVVTENQRDGKNGHRSDRVVIRVIDNGVGIPRENLERVFDPFFTTKPAGSGVGLGLAQCQRIILSNRGTIRIDSEVGKGSTVTISLPAVETSQAQSQVGALR